MVSSEEKIAQKWRCPVTDVEYHEGAGSEYTRSLTKGSTGSVVIQSSTYQRLSDANSGMYMNFKRRPRRH